MKAENFKILEAIEAKTNVLSRSLQGKALLRNINSVDWRKMAEICKEETGLEFGSGCSGCSGQNLRRIKKLAEAYYQERARREKEAFEKQKAAAKEEEAQKKEEKKKAKAAK